METETTLPTGLCEKLELLEGTGTTPRPTSNRSSPKGNSEGEWPRFYTPPAKQC